MGRLNPRPALIPQPERYAETRTAEPWRHAFAAPTWRLGWTKGAALTTQPYSARLLVIPHRNRVVADLTDQGALALAAPSHRVAPQVREFALALAVDDLEHLLADRHTIVRLHGTEVGANHPQVVAVRDVALRSQVGDEHIEIVANEIRIQVVDALEGFLGVLGHGGRGPLQQDHRLLRAGTRHVVTNRKDALADTPKEHVFAFDFTVVPVHPAVFSAVHRATVRQAQGLLESRVEPFVQGATDIAPDQVYRRPTAGHHHPGSIQDIDIQLAVDELALATERCQRRVAVRFVIRHSLVQQGFRPPSLGCVTLFERLLCGYARQREHPQEQEQGRAKQHHGKFLND